MHESTSEANGLLDCFLVDSLLCWMIHQKGSTKYLLIVDCENWGFFGKFASFGKTEFTGCSHSEKVRGSQQHLWNWGWPKGKQTNRKSMKGIGEKEWVTKRKVMAIIVAIHHETVLGVGVICHPSIEPLALWVVVDKTVWSQANPLMASDHLLLHKASKAGHTFSQ